MPKILVVEDDALVRDLAVELLSELGHDLQEAGTAADAMIKANASASSLDALVVDIGLPDQPGDELVRALRKAHPQIPVLIASGGSEADLKRKFADDGRVGVVGKPYMMETLERALAALGVASATPRES